MTLVCVPAIVCNLAVALASGGSITSSQDTGPILAAIIAAMASVANTIILTRVHAVQKNVNAQVGDVTTQVETIKEHAEQFISTDAARGAQIALLQELSRDRERQIAQLRVLADRLSGHIEHLQGREQRTRED